MNCTSVFYTDINYGADSFGYSTGVFRWDGTPKYMNIRDFGKVLTAYLALYRSAMRGTRILHIGTIVLLPCMSLVSVARGGCTHQQNNHTTKDRQPTISLTHQFHTIPISYNVAEPVFPTWLYPMRRCMPSLVRPSHCMPRSMSHLMAQSHTHCTSLMLLLTCGRSSPLPHLNSAIPNWLIWAYLTTRLLSQWQHTPDITLSCHAFCRHSTTFL